MSARMEYLDPFLTLNSTSSFVKIVFGLGAISKAAYSSGIRPPKAVYLTGGLGCAIPLGLGLAQGVGTTKHIAVVEGDGSLLHAPNSLLTVAFSPKCNLDIIILENKVYGSTGGQPITALQGGLDLTRVARSTGINQVARCKDKESLRNYLSCVKPGGVRFFVAEVSQVTPSLPPVPEIVVRSSLLPATF